MAERVGFEPTVRLRARRFSKPVHSATLSPLLMPYVASGKAMRYSLRFFKPYFTHKTKKGALKLPSLRFG